MSPGGGLVRMLVFLAMILLGYYALMYMFPGARDQEPNQVSYTRFKRMVSDGQIASVTIQGKTLRGKLESQKAEGASGQKKARDVVVTTRPPFEDPGLLPLFERQEVEVEARSQEEQWWLPALLTMLPWLLIIGGFLWLAHRARKQAAQGGLGGFGPGSGLLGGFGRSQAKRYQKKDTDDKYDDVAGLEEAKRELQEVVDFLRQPDKYKKLGAKVPRGVLLMGPPGTGKTLLARATAGEADVPFFSISGSEFIEMFVGVGASRVRNMFQEAKSAAPSIVFIDEIDSIGRARGTGLGGGHDEREQTLNQILSEMDGFSPHEAVVVLAGTNRPDVLDPALMRPGRFDRKVTLELPRREARLRILRVHTRKVQLADDVDLEKMARATAGLSGADLENLVNEATMCAARKDKDTVGPEDFEEARDKIVLGSKRDQALSERERRRVAYHEAGHALVAMRIEHADPVRQVTIVPRGHALGATEQTPDEDRQTLSQSELHDRIAVMLGGRGAEKLVFGERSSGADNDLKQATRLARKMVSQWGMSDELGAASFRYGEEQVFLGREMASQRRDFSEHVARILDREIQRIVNEQDARAERILREHRDRLEALAERLLEAELLHDAEIREIVEASGERQAREREAS